MSVRATPAPTAAPAQALAICATPALRPVPAPVIKALSNKILHGIGGGMLPDVADLCAKYAVSDWNHGHFSTALQEGNLDTCDCIVHFLTFDQLAAKISAHIRRLEDGYFALCTALDGLEPQQKCDKMAELDGWASKAATLLSSDRTKAWFRVTRPDLLGDIAIAWNTSRDDADEFSYAVSLRLPRPTSTVILLQGDRATIQQLDELGCCLTCQL